MNYQQKTLTNGLNLITVPMAEATSVTVWVLVHTGSKYETKRETGLSHFLEHMCFKGTVKRPTALAISSELDSIGAQSNAFTVHEATGYYAKAHPKHFEKILDIVADMYVHPVFDEKEIEKEKGVIIEEINMYEDMPHRLVQDFFMESVYGDQPAGWSILGTKESVTSFVKEDFLDYRRRHYVADGTTVIVSGKFDDALVLEKVEKAFDGIPTTPKQNKIAVVESQTKPQVFIKHKETDQAHLVLGLRAFGAQDSRMTALKLLSVILGGGMSSRLWQKIREEMGVGYYIGSGVDEYTDHGLLSVSAGVDSRRIAEVVAVIAKELSVFKTELVGEAELEKAKEYSIGNLYLGLESSDSLAEYYGNQDVSKTGLLSPEELCEKIKEVTAEDIRAVARDIIVPQSLNLAIIGNINNKDELEQVLVV